MSKHENIAADSTDSLRRVVRRLEAKKYVDRWDERIWLMDARKELRRREATDEMVSTLRAALVGHDPSPQTECGQCGHKCGDRFWHVDGLGFDLPDREIRCPNCGLRLRKVPGSMEVVVEYL